MTRTANARIAGFTFLAYIAAGITSMILYGTIVRGEGMAARLAELAHHATGVGVVVLLGLVQSFSALVLAVTLYAITRVEDRDLALLGLVCRVSEGLIGAFAIPGILALFWLATATGADAPDPAAAHVLGQYLMRGDVAFTATFFAVGSTLFSWLLLRGRMIPVPLAWLGVAASVLLVVCLPLQLAGFLGAPITTFMYLPMLAFEVPLGFWFLIKGVAAPATAPSA
ncbi:MAG TPA: DUF4386 domain-containing protein [Candidatus Saccharimonadales bacterium]|nr:DUF4386 domain-containing protein [Candidatus Saccharimonadales bacterium]